MAQQTETKHHGMMSMGPAGKRSSGLAGMVRGGTLVTLAMAAMALLSVSLPLWSQNLSPGSSEKSAPVSVEEPKLSVRPTGKMPEIGVGDLLKISVFGAPESDQEVRVNSDGNVVLNFVGPVHIAGLTNEQAQTLVAGRLKEGSFYNEPQVTVFTKEYATQGVSVLGEVNKPGVYPVLGARRLFDVLSLAGGTTQKAGKSISITRRNQPEQAIMVNLSSYQTNSMEANIEVWPGDTVLVSRAGVVYVVGEVHKPSGVVMENGSMTVLQAIAMAEGTSPLAALNKAKLIRKSSDGHQEIPLELKNMLQSKAPDVQLQAEDIIFVPASAGKTAGKRSLEAIVQAATGLAIYGVR